MRHYLFAANGTVSQSNCRVRLPLRWMELNEPPMVNICKKNQYRWEIWNQVLLILLLLHQTNFVLWGQEYTSLLINDPKSMWHHWYFVTKIVLNFCEKNSSSDPGKLLKFETEDRESANLLRNQEKVIHTVKG